MNKLWPLLAVAGLIACAGAFWFPVPGVEAVAERRSESSVIPEQRWVDGDFRLEVLVDNRPLETYYAGGKTYIEAREGAEYEIRIRNPWPYRIAVALSVDGLNSIDARRTSAWNASKWVIGPYETILVGGWQMSSERARRFYFTTERDSYAAKLGQGSNLGVISAVFYRERTPIPIPIVPPPRPRSSQDRGTREERAESPSASTLGREQVEKRRESNIPLDDESAATGIGRSVQNDVRWVHMELDSRPAAQVTLRYEYYPALVHLGIFPRPYQRVEPLTRRERATGFEDGRFSPEP